MKKPSREGIATTEALRSESCSGEKGVKVCSQEYGSGLGRCVLDLPAQIRWDLCDELNAKARRGVLGFPNHPGVLRVSFKAQPVLPGCCISLDGRIALDCPRM